MCDDDLPRVIHLINIPDLSTSLSAEMLQADKGLLLLLSPCILVIYNAVHVWDFPSSET